MAKQDSMKRSSGPFAAMRWLALIVAACALGGCIYDTPLTAAATRPVDPRLVGDWVPKTVKTSAEARRLIRTNLANPKLYVDEPMELVRRE